MKKKFPSRPVCRPTPSIDPPQLMRVVRLTTCEAGTIVQAVRILRGALLSISRITNAPQDACREVTELSCDDLEQCLRGLVPQMPAVQTFELCCVEHAYGLRVVDIATFRKALFDYECYIAQCLPSARLNAVSLANWLKAAEKCRALRRKLAPPI